MTWTAKALGFDTPLLERAVAVGWTSHTEARVWARSPSRGPLVARTRQGGRIEGTADAQSDGCVSLLLTGLQADRDYSVRVEEPDGTLVGEATFHTAPEPGCASADDTFSFAVMSCNSPFDEQGRPDDGAMGFVEAARDVLLEQHCRRALFVGDQVYADQPEAMSLFEPAYLQQITPERSDDILDWSADQVRRMYHLRQRLFLGPAPVQRLMSSFASSYMLDDHEVIDNFGSARDHGLPSYAALRTGALDAYYDYQGRRVQGEASRPESFDHAIPYGSVATYVMDLRSQKQVLEDGSQQFFAPEQLARLTDFLASSGKAEVVLLVLTIPILHVPSWLVQAGTFLTPSGSDADDRWAVTSQGNRDSLLRVLYAHRKRHPAQRFILISGDIHVGMVSEIRWGDDVPGLLQLTSSALTNRQSPLLQVAAEWTPRMHTSMDVEGLPDVSGHMLEGIGALKRNPCGGLNFGVLLFRRTPDGLTVRLRLYEEDAEQGAKLVFESAEL